MKISEYKNEDAIELLADLLEPAAEIFSDKVIRDKIGDGSKIEMARILLKGHKSSVLEILARLNGVAVEDYTCNPITILVELIAILSDKELVDFFVLQAKEMSTMSSIVPAEIIEADGQ